MPAAAGESERPGNTAGRVAGRIMRGRGVTSSRRAIQNRGRIVLPLECPVREKRTNKGRFVQFLGRYNDRGELVAAIPVDAGSCGGGFLIFPSRRWL